MVNLITKLATGSIVLLCLLTISTITAAGNVYKWTDENGVVHYGDQAPLERQNQAQLIKENRKRSGEFRGNAGATDNSAPSSVSTTTAQPADEAATQEQEKQAQAQELIAQEKQRLTEECQKARENLARFETYSRVRVTDDGGQPRYLGDDEKQKMEQETRTFIQNSCLGI